MHSCTPRVLDPTHHPHRSPRARRVQMPHTARSSPRQPQGHASQVDYIASLCPPSTPRAAWEAALEERSRAAAARCASRSGSSGDSGDGASGGTGVGAWEEMVYTWACLHDMLVAAHEEMGGVVEAPAAAAGAEGPGGVAGATGVAVGLGGAGQEGGAVAAPAAAGAGAGAPSLEEVVLALYEHESRCVHRGCM